MSDTTKVMTTLQDGFAETQFQLKEMKDYVDHFADNLVLNSQQITVDTYAGFSNKPATLTEILKLCHNNFEDIVGVNNKQNEEITKMFGDLDTKAPDSVLFNIMTLEKKVGTIELHIQKEEEQGMGALRKQCEELSVHMQGMSAELAEKIDRDSVGFIVHEKYEEIVRYLQDALQSSLEDENNFKEKADEIQEMVILLSNSKADRSEIANMQEMMVKTEAMMKKMGGNEKLKEKIKDFVPKKEMEALLATKVDRQEFEEQLQSALSSTRRTKKLASLSTSLQMPVDKTTLNDYSLAASTMDQQQHQYNRQLSPSENSQNGSNKFFPSHASNKRPGSAGQGVGGGGGFPGGNGLNSTSQVFQIEPPAPHTQPPVTYQPIPVIAIGQGLTGAGERSSSPNRNKSPDFGQYMKMKGGKGKASNTIVGSHSLANLEAPPGAFRRATEGGKPGGCLVNSDRPRSANIEGFGSSEYPFTDPQYAMNYSDQSKLTDHLAYLHGPIAGGGFNVRNAHLKAAPIGSKPIANDDVEGKGL
jgi:hypothetical protein